MKDGIGFLAVLGGFGVALVVWGIGATPALTGGFEGEGRDFSVVWLELPVMLLGTPALALGVWALFRRRSPAVLALAVLATLLTAGWAGAEWLETRVPEFRYEQGAAGPVA
ncbi:hypothetical protein [Streptomyces roseicoloratus]|uniref:Uncharacterized protein n=1 Tax=Streptomyces roseicoloratus TaxID=2508722 RepID=A0ABY9RUS9_9ACTN|nr:hypothetical protein [Streptomyces roseicoloratus]WMX45241.1 hypothetical protein RGF97_10800 [Streptomyces roseicoloratus]